MYSVDINCDMGESFGNYKIGNDNEILDFITSANIACGFHAGDPNVMDKTVKMALEKGVLIGAHVGFPDLVGFGRKNMNVSIKEAYNMTVYQIGALEGFIKAYGGKMNHVKPHGAFYNMAAKDEKLARAIAEAIYKVNPELILFGLSGSNLIKEGEKVGLKVANEVFADRTYTKFGTLTPRVEENALIKDKKKALNQVIKMIKQGKVISTDLKEISIKANTICIHGDNEKALEFAKYITQELKNNEIKIKGI